LFVSSFSSPGLLCSSRVAQASPKQSIDPVANHNYRPTARLPA
jgi:hypothetical protein